MQVAERTQDEMLGGEPIQVPAFLGMTEQQSRLLVALYNETDPEFAKQMPTALPIAAQQLASEYEKRNSVGKKVRYLIKKILEANIVHSLNEPTADGRMNTSYLIKYNEKLLKSCQRPI